MYRNKSPFAKGRDSDSDGAPPKFNRTFQAPKQPSLNAESPTASTQPEQDSLSLEFNFDRTITSFDSLVDFCKDQFKDVYKLFKTAKNRIIKVERSTDATTHRVEGISHANDIMVGKVEMHGLRIEKLEKYRMQDLQDIDKSFTMQKQSIDDLQLKIESVKEMMGNYLPKAEFYQLSGNFVRDDVFKFFEESVERNYLPGTIFWTSIIPPSSRSASERGPRSRSGLCLFKFAILEFL